MDVKKYMKSVFKCCGIMFLALVGIGFAFITIQIVLAPNLSEVDAAPDGYLTTILDKDENVVDTLYVTESNRIYVDLEDIPKKLQEAFIAIEDSRFYSHHGIDPKGVLRALGHGITSGNFSQGASTITQQLLKNNVFTDWMDEENLYDKVCRKIQEQYLALRLEQKYSKEWILESYLNTINLGGGTRGVQVAAQYYFGKDVSELSLAECALIAGITKNPTAYNPLNYPKESVARQQLVLNAMLKQGYISQEEYDAVILEDVIASLNSVADKPEEKVFSWFEDALLTQIADDLMVKYRYDESKAWDVIYSGGLTIYSTQDTHLQNICEIQATKPGWYAENEEVSIVMTDVSTGAVAAIVGGSKEKTTSLSYNRATDAIRQPGSTIKVIGEYAAAIDAGKVSLGTVINDEPYTYSDGTAIHNAYDTPKGMTTIREAIVSSGNVVALKAFQMVGEDKVYEYLQKFGITTLTEEDKNEALAIGGTYNGVTNLELTAAYNAIANSGRYIEPYYYTKVVDRDGNAILENDLKYEQIIKKESAELLTSAMEDVITRGTGVDAVVNGITLAGKSGSTNGNKDLWFVGFSPYYTCGIWGGHDDNSAQTNTKYVKQIWQQIMEDAHRDKEDISLVDTENLTSVTICTKCGKLATHGLCDDTVQGNMTQEEYYVKGTQPKSACDCHVRVSICEESQMAAGIYCPNRTTQDGVYLKTASAETQDSWYVVPENTEETCDVHVHFWDQWFGNDSDDQREEQEEPEKNSNWWDDLFTEIFG